MKVSVFAGVVALCFMLAANPAQAKADIAELYADAVLSGNAAELDKLLAPNFWYIGANGHIRDKENFLSAVRNKTLIVERLTLSNQRETQVGDTRLITANGVFQGRSPEPGPHGLMRFTLALANNHGKEQVALFQATPVIATAGCADGNCTIK